jgi:uncharacterized membrane protein YkvA (DUF1232 family)
MNPTNAEEEFVKEGAEKMTEKDVEKVVVKSEDIQQKFTGRGPLHRFIEDAKLLIAMAKDYWKKNYRQVPFGVIGAIAFTLIYVLNPFDLVPDVLPIIGEIDDAAVFAACLMLIESDLRKYKDWKENHPAPPQITG